MNRATRTLIASTALACLLPLSSARAALTEADKTELLQQHNVWRAKFHTPPLVWDETVARTAQQWAATVANSGALAHRPDTTYGENIWSGTADGFSLSSIVDAWCNEITHYDLHTHTCAAGHVCGHFTQLVWQATLRLGCGKATGKDGNDYVVCNYDPAGNMQGQHPFPAFQSDARGEAKPSQAPTR